MTTYDAIVIGMGSMGSSAAYHLAKEGASVLGIEQFAITHDQGSHAGQSRIIRKSYYEHPDYVPLLERAYTLWRELERRTGAEVYVPTGLLYSGKANHPLIQGSKLSAETYRIPFEPLDHATRSAKYPQFRFPDDHETWMEPDAGFVTPERAILLYTDLALSLGAEVRSGERVRNWVRGQDGVTVHTDKGSYQAKKLVVTAGPWAGQLIPKLEDRLIASRQVVAWVMPKDPGRYQLGDFPCWTYADEDKPGIYYGFPILPVGRFGGPIGLKMAYHHPAAPTDPDAVDRVIHEPDEQEIRMILDTVFPEINAELLTVKTCLYTNTPDEHFVIDFAPGQDEDVVVAAGFSGHGFKFASVMGEVLADLALVGKTTHPIGFLSPNRFLSGGTPS
jgi:sarcosine oxidase